MSAARRIGVTFGLLVLVLIGTAGVAQAHPLGNFTTNHHSGLRIGPAGVRVDYVLDLAEVPAYQARRTELDADADGAVSTSEERGYAERTCAVAAGTASLRVAGREAPLRVRAARISFPGAAGLSTLRLECDLDAAARIGPDTAVSYRDGLYPDRVGWREVTAVGDHMVLVRSDVPTSSSSGRLTRYPTDLLADPLDQRGADLVASPGGTAAGGVQAGSAGAADARGVDALTAWFTDFVGRPQLTWTLGLLAVLIATVLGAVHALAPGHGKTVMAAFLVGERGSLRQAGVIALTVTLTHTAGVLVLGIVLTTSLVLAPERLFGWLGLASGLLLAGVGITLLRRAVAAARRPATAPARELVTVGAPDHHHGHGHGHHHGHGHGHGHHHHGGGLGTKSLVAMGFAGGLVPSPSALVVLLGAVALGRTWFGVLLVLGYGAGMAGTLTGVGFALARWRSVVERRLAGRYGGLAQRWLPIGTAALIVVVGVGLAARALAGV